MAKIAGARRYAQAAFELALEKGELERWQADLPPLVEIMLEPSVGALLDSPRVALADKVRLLRQSLPNVSPQAQNLACILVAARRREIIGLVAQEFQRRLDAHRGIVRAQVTSAIPLEPPEMERLSQRLSALLGRQVLVEPRVDPSIIGGFMARAGDLLINGSTRSQLEGLKSALSSSKG
ncbi:MAG: F0F1 ATP synthase subunit delta [Chloroflexi bacterium]|nr:F0F1 ATP synthase subunit delta [Chloroflexota bacterium]